MSINLPKIIASVLLCLSVGGLSSFFTASEITGWYSTLNKPFFSPPNWIFAPVWTTLYVLMGISLYLLWISNKKGKQKALKFFFIQLILNFFWSIIFFGFHSPQLAFVEIIFMWIFILMTIKAALPVSRVSAYLLYPYLAWVSFASILNLSIFLLN